MKRRFWTHSEIDFIRDNIAKMGVGGCAKALNRTKSSLQHKMSREGIKHPVRWSKKDELELENLYHTMPTKEIGKLFGKTANQVQNKARKMGLARENFYPEDRFCKICGTKLANKYMKPNHCQDCVGSTLMGSNNHMWKGGVRTLSRMMQSLLRPWKRRVLKRDSNKCQMCGEIENLNIHHLCAFQKIRDKVIEENPNYNIQIFEDRKKLAVIIANQHKIDDGITLCRQCHVKIHSEKQGELLENPNGNAEDNQQPSALNVIDFVDAKVQRLTGEEITTDNPDTSALHTPYSVMI